MRAQILVSRRLPTMLLIGFFVLLMTMPTSAQDEPSAPQFLYRSENRLVLVNGYMGEATELPIDAAPQDRFVWSSDGQYLLAWIDGYCLNLYDVDVQEWAYNELISCAVQDAVFSADGTRIAYSTGDVTDGVLGLYSLTDKKNQELFRAKGNEPNPGGVSHVQWSPTEAYLTFVSYHWIMGGTLNSFVVMNVDSQDYFTVQVANPYSS